MSRRSGRHFLQIPGPTNVPDRVLRAIDRATIDHRGPDFSAMARSVLADIRTIFKTKNPVVIYTASGTGAWEAALVNTLAPGDRVLMYETGQFSTLFETTTSDDVAQSIYAALPMDSMPLHRVDTPAAFKPITGQERHRWAQASVCITATAHGEGRVMGLDYFDQQHINYAFRNQRSFSPWIPDKGDVSLMHDRLMYDYAFALLTRCILWASAHESDVALAVSVEAPETDLTAPVDQNIEAVSWSTKTPAVVIDRDDCPESSIQVTLTPHRDFSNKLRIHYTIRDRTGTILKVQTVPVKHEKDVPVTQALPVPTLRRGTYFVGVRVVASQE